MKKLYISIITSIILLVLGVISVYVIAVITYNQQPKKIETTLKADKPMLYYVNNFRKKNNLSELAANPELNNSAKAKAQDMNDLNYFDHTRPNGDGFETLIAANYMHNGLVDQNLDKCAKSNQEAIEDFYKSPEHKKTMFDPTFKQFGEASIYSKKQSCYLFVNDFSD